VKTTLEEKGSTFAPLQNEGKCQLKTVRESYVKRLRDNYLLILRTLMHDLIVSIDTDGNFAFVNDAAIQFFGGSRKKLIGSHFSDYIHPDDLKRALGALQELIEQKGQVTRQLLGME
jgi:PAS domain-containing protein